MKVDTTTFVMVMSFCFVDMNKPLLWELHSQMNICSNMAAKPPQAAVTMRDLCPALQNKTYFN